VASEPDLEAKRPRLSPAMADARRAIRQCLDDNAPAPGSLFLVAVSGGADSLALAWAASFVIPRAGHLVEAVIIDHRLQADSAEVARRAADQVGQWGMASTIYPVDIDHNDNLEQRAREARYQALTDEADTKGAVAVLLGHTLDDQAETVLMGLTRGSGPASIRGMEPVSGLWWRPFLGLRRETTQAVCRGVGFEWWDDPHNSDDRFLRPRIRHRVMPVLEEQMGPGVTEALARTGRLIRDDLDELDRQAWTLARSLGDGFEIGVIPVSTLRDTPRPIASRLLRVVAQQSIGSHLAEVHTDQVLRLVTHWSGQASVDIPAGRVERQGDVLRLIPDSGRSHRE